MDTKRYIDLLIFQYQMPRAQQTIKTFTQPTCDCVNNILLKLINAFDLEKAQSKQLDIIGRYVGQSRNFNTIFDYKKFVYADDDGTIALKGVGYSTPDNLKDATYLTPQNINKASYTANDEDYRFMIKLKIFKNNNLNTNTDYYNFIKELFNNQIIFKDNRNMSIDYILLDVDDNIKNILKSNKYYLPAPSGVRINLIVALRTKFIYGYADANNNKADYITGYSTPDNLKDATYLNATELF